ncbi:unnamed protein product, partial [Symbiodinium pilosum]
PTSRMPKLARQSWSGSWPTEKPMPKCRLIGLQALFRSFRSCEAKLRVGVLSVQMLTAPEQRWRMASSASAAPGARRNWQRESPWTKSCCRQRAWKRSCSWLRRRQMPPHPVWQPNGESSRVNWKSLRQACARRKPSWQMTSADWPRRMT